MPRKSPAAFSQEHRKELYDKLWTSIALLEHKDEVERFFKDMLSETETLMLARRLSIAQLLLRGDGYESIAHSFGASEGTIAAVHRSILRSDGYTHAITRLQKELNRKNRIAGRKERSHDPSSFESLKRRYPLHFLLFTLFDEARDRAPKQLRKK